jgi:endonuclease/exonuclease/phosphatase family metal-dependent hydrolase
VFLQEVRLFHQARCAALRPHLLRLAAQGQAEFLAPEGYDVAYRTNAVTRHGEHGNALLSRWPIGDVGHHDVSDHRFEQRGLLHVPVQWNGDRACGGGALRADARQPRAPGAAPGRLHRPRGAGDAPLVVAGDFNDWGEKLDGPMAAIGLQRAPGAGRPRPALTFPSLMPVFALDRFYLRGLHCRTTMVPRGISWARMSDHLPLVAELEPD